MERDFKDLYKVEFNKYVKCKILLRLWTRRHPFVSKIEQTETLLHKSEF